MAVAAIAGMAIQAGVGIAKSIQQKREAARMQKKEDAARQRREAKLKQMETEAEQETMATQAPGAEVAQEIGERNLATTYGNITRTAGSTTGALLGASAVHQKQGQIAQAQQVANDQFRTEARRNLARVRGMGLQMQSPDIREFSGRAQNLAYAADMNLANAFNVIGTGAQYGEREGWFKGKGADATGAATPGTNLGSLRKAGQDFRMGSVLFNQ